MIKKIIIITSMLLAGQNSFAEDKILAQVNGSAIHESEVKDRVTEFLATNNPLEDENKALSYDKLDSKAKAEALRSMILSDLILAEAKKYKIEEDQEYKKKINFLKNQFMQKIYIEKIVKEAVTEDKIQAAYKQMLAEYTNKYEYKVSHILVDSEETASTIKTKLNKGDDFAKLAKEYSLDNNKEEGGSLDYFSQGQMVEDFEKATQALKIGEVSGIVKTEFGYHIIKLEDKRKMVAPSLAQVKEQISTEIANQFIKNYIDALELKNKVKILE